MGLSNKIKRNKLKTGDHIYTKRFLYSHHGIYIGNGEVIHFTREDGQQRSPITSWSMNSTGFEQKLNGVEVCGLDEFLQGGKLYRFKYAVSKAFFLAKVMGGTCTLARSDPPDEVLHRAKYLLHYGFGIYDLFKNNCEDFAIYCKTGLVLPKTLPGGGRSGQISSLWIMITSSMNAGIFAAGWIPTTVAVAVVGATTGMVWILGIWAAISLVGLAIGCVGGRLSMDVGFNPHFVKVPVENLHSQNKFA